MGLGVVWRWRNEVEREGGKGRESGEDTRMKGRTWGKKTTAAATGKKNGDGLRGKNVDLLFTLEKKGIEPKSRSSKSID